MNAKEALLKFVQNNGIIILNELPVILNALDRLEELEKVLKIIKEKCSCFFSIFDKNEFSPGTGYMVYDNELYQHNDLTKEEFDLLKEYLK